MIEDILKAVEASVDMFDCVMPTRNARNGILSTSAVEKFVYLRIAVLNDRWFNRVVNGFMAYIKVLAQP